MLTTLDMLWKIIFIVFFFGFCIFIHEFGHMLAALWQGLHVERFSIGLGSPVCKLFTWKGVDFCIGWLPFGGYVALPQLDATDTPKTEDNKALEPCKPLPKAIVAFAGPFFNVLFGFLLATIMWYAGLWEAPPASSCVITSVQQTLPLYKNGLKLTDNIVAFDHVETNKFLEEICTDLPPDGPEHTVTVLRDNEKVDIPFKAEPNPEWQAGLRRGDRITAVNGKRFRKGQEEMTMEYVFNKEPHITLSVSRDGKPMDFKYIPQPNPMMENLGAPFFTVKNPLVLGGVIPGSPAAKAGLVAGDLLLQINDTNIIDGKHFLNLISALQGAPFSMVISRNGRECSIDNLTCPTPFTLDSFGAFFSVVVANCMENMPAYQAGIRKGDRIVRINDQEVLDSEQLTKYIRASKGAELKVTIMRDGKESILSMRTRETNLNGVPTHVIGINLSDSTPKIIVHTNPWTQFSRIVSQTTRTLGLLFSPVTSKITGHGRGTATVKIEHMSGPLGILMMMWYSLKNEGLRGGFALIILITFSLAFMNLLPIPALDGSYILFSIIEIIIRRKLPAKLLNWLVTGFFYLLLALIVYITFFDGRRMFRLLKVGSTKGVPAKVQKAQPQVNGPQENPGQVKEGE